MPATKERDIQELLRRRAAAQRRLREIDAALIGLGYELKRARGGGGSAQPAAPRFSFDEKVKVESSRSQNSKINGRVGIVRGMSRNRGAWEYAVFVPDAGECWDLKESELRSTGAFESASASAASIRVRVDKRGRGSIVPPDDRSGHG